MPFQHITTKDSDTFENAVRNGTFVFVEGIKWIAGQAWVSAFLETAGFEHGIVYWPGPVSSLVGIDFGDHEIATRAIMALHGTEFEGYTLKACWHKDVGDHLRQLFTSAY